VALHHVAHDAQQNTVGAKLVLLDHNAAARQVGSYAQAALKVIGCTSWPVRHGIDHGRKRRRLQGRNILVGAARRLDVQ
jgi:hypothetical protein